MRRVSKGHGFWISYILNMLFRAEWLFGAILLFLLYIYFKIKILLWLAILALAVWFIYPLVITLVLGWANKVGNEPTPRRENKNPYSNGVSKEKGAEDYMCPCCGKYKLDEIGKYEICPVCKWEDDPSQRRDPDFAGGANKVSLNEARKQFRG